MTNYKAYFLHINSVCKPCYIRYHKCTVFSLPELVSHFFLYFNFLVITLIIIEKFHYGQELLIIFRTMLIAKTFLSVSLVTPPSSCLSVCRQSHFSQAKHRATGFLGSIMGCRRHQLCNKVSLHGN